MSHRELHRLRQLENDVKRSGGLQCPDASCGDSGTCTGVEIDRNGDPCPVPEQCEFCWTVEDSVFNRNRTCIAQEHADDDEIPF